MANVMKTSFMSCLAVVLVLGSAQLSAGGFGHHGYGHHHGGHHYGHQGAYAPYFVGGLLLGALLAPPQYAPPSEVIYVERPSYIPPRVVYTQPAAPAGRRLLRTLNGECFERSFDTSGTELRSQLPASACAW